VPKWLDDVAIFLLLKGGKKMKRILIGILIVFFLFFCPGVNITSVI